MKADLHVHSTISDGSFSREEIVQMAIDKKLTHISFTDHDCTTGFDKLSGLSEDLVIVPGVEISAFDFEKGKKVHVLGYDYKNPEPIDSLCTPLLRKRHENSLKQIEILADNGYQICEGDVLKYSGEYIYKQHILKYLVDTNQADEMFGDVYKNIFKNGGVCHFDIRYIDACEAVKAIKQAGGYAVLAHCGQQKNYSSVKKLKLAGLDGIELFHPSNDDEALDRILTIAEDYELFCTGGSDFHGEYEKEHHQVGDWVSPKNPIVSRKNCLI